MAATFKGAQAGLRLDKQGRVEGGAARGDHRQSCCRRDRDSEAEEKIRQIRQRAEKTSRGCKHFGLQSLSPARSGDCVGLLQDECLTT